MKRFIEEIETHKLATIVCVIWIVIALAIVMVRQLLDLPLPDGWEAVIFAPMISIIAMFMKRLTATVDHLEHEREWRERVMQREEERLDRAIAANDPLLDEFNELEKNVADRDRKRLAEMDQFERAAYQHQGEK